MPNAGHEGWLTTEQAADILCVHARSLARLDGESLRRIKRNPNGKRPNGTGYLWWRRDIERVAMLRKGAHLSLNAALRIMEAIQAGDVDLGVFVRREFAVSAGPSRHT